MNTDQKEVSATAIENAPLPPAPRESDGVTTSTQLTAPTLDQPATRNLWSSKELELLWLGCEDHWAIPSLHDRAPDHDTTDGPGCGPAWYWPVTPEFGGWCLRTLRKAKQANTVGIAPGVQAAFYAIRSYLQWRHPGCWSEVERIASAGPVLLPAIPPTFIDLARFGFVPRWRGFERHLGTAPAVEAEVVDESPKARRAVQPRPRKSARRVTPDRPALFQ